MTTFLRTALSRQRFSFDLVLLVTARAVKKASNLSSEPRLVERSLNSTVVITTTIVTTAAVSIVTFDTYCLITFIPVCLSLVLLLMKHLFTLELNFSLVQLLEGD